MAEKYGRRPSEFLNAPLGEFALDSEVFAVAVGLENQIERARAKNPKVQNAADLVLVKLRRDAAAEERYQERKRRGD